jgi:hypothetical protein
VLEDSRTVSVAGKRTFSRGFLPSPFSIRPLIDPSEAAGDKD